MMLSFSDDELEMIQMALRLAVEHTKAVVKATVNNADVYLMLFARGRINRLIERIEQYNEDKENGDA